MKLKEKMKNGMTKIKEKVTSVDFIVGAGTYLVEAAILAVVAKFVYNTGQKEGYDRGFEYGWKYGRAAECSVKEKYPDYESDAVDSLKDLRTKH